METKKVITALNKVIALEHAAVLQYQQQGLLVSGLWRRGFAEFFTSQSKSSLEHAHKFGQKIVALGGVPSVEIGAPIQQSTDLEEMLRHALELERTTLRAYLDVHALVNNDVALRTMIESQIESEQHDIEELEMYLGAVKLPGAERGSHLRRAK
jgi:bacterioferritin